ncbi:leucine-rich repeat-containing protein 74A-like [Haliotis rufescens]|uniref:leucine-rich repeat-containing protein 74A-like n=1 Tax=Haliotis rufescens TaxID=6454 RepID=UPI00201F6763|nr:leucine-rich repeat-containing protein 74A-like [Haliotis rufescens]
MSVLRPLKHGGSQALATQFRLALPQKKTMSQIVHRARNVILEEELNDEEEEPPALPKRVFKMRLSQFDCDYMDEYDFDKDDDSDSEAIPEGIEDESQNAYMTACRDLGIISNKNIMDSLLTSTMTLTNQRLTTKDIRAFSIALLKNSSIDVLTLDSNSLQPKGIETISQILPHKREITELSITNNSLGSLGAKELCEVLVGSSTIKKVDFSGNGFTEKDAEYFKEVLEENNVIKEMNLSHNEMREKGGSVLAEGIVKNDCLRVLDLSWNHLRLAGAAAIGESLQTNNTLEEIYLGWNGFNVRGCLALGKALETNSNLRVLDLTCNRICELSVSQLLKGLIANTTLEVLKLPLNGIYPSGALTLLKVLEKYKTITVSHVDLGTQSVTEEFIQLKTTLEATRKLKVLHGPVLRQELKFSAIQEELDELVEKSIDDLMKEHPMTVLFEFARQQNFRILDMFTTLDSDKSGTLTRQEFEEGFIKVNIPIPNAALHLLLNKMDLNNDGVVDYGELVFGHREYKRKVREAIAEEDFTSTEIGRISTKIKDLMKKKFLMRTF